jgi:nicotinate-nucleotide--dimethylbenzimidazole phosphoribosyltransferase
LNSESMQTGELWERPLPRIGDISTSAERSADLSGWSFDQTSRDALHRIIEARRDIRKFRPDSIAPEVIHRILSAGHRAPSVGHSQPWRFITVTDPAIRQTAAVMADRERLRQAAALNPDSARRLLDLQLEGIREAPVGMVVACDRRTSAQGVLGRATFPDADMWSAACAIQNIWLAARAEGLGLGWVTLFEPSELAKLLNLPSGVETLGWLCIGWPDERPPAPGLERVGWSKRLPLEDVIYENLWPQSPNETSAPKSHLIAPNQDEIVRVRDEVDPLLTTPSSLGTLDRAVDKLLSLQERGHREEFKVLSLIVASDHLVTQFDISAFESRVSEEIAAATEVGCSVGASLATAAGFSFRLHDAGLFSRGRDLSRRGNIVDSAGLTYDETEELIQEGITLAKEISEKYDAIALGEIGIGNTTIAAALASALLNELPSEMVGLGAGSDSEILANKERVITQALKRVGSIDDPSSILAELGGGEFAVMVGVILGATKYRLGVILDGLATSTAALIAVRIDSACQAVLIAGQRSRERAHISVLEELGLEAVLDNRIRSGEGGGAILAASILTTIARARRSTARTEKIRIEVDE